MFSEMSYFQDLNVIEFFRVAGQYIDVYDPGRQSGNLAIYLTYSARQDVIQSFNTAYTKASEARQLEKSGDYTSAIVKWKWIFGQDFPS